MTRFIFNRRRALAALASTTALATAPFTLKAHVTPENPVFRHGVASGDPDTTSVVLWTRISAEGGQQVLWEIARDLQFADSIDYGTFHTDAARDYTVKLLATGLEPGQTYYYRFKLGEVTSPIGRARTLPAGHVEQLGIALASCSNYPFGFFNAYDAIAHDPGVDFVLHTGDYIYEYGADGWGAETGKAIGRVHEPAREITSLADYRQRHAQYKSDAGAQAMHAAHPLLACWDDHESANNPWTGGAQNHQPDSEGDWQARREASIRAYFEWMPVREPEWLNTKGRSRMQFWRNYVFGDLAMLHTLETRHTARTEQIDYAKFAEAGDDTHRAIIEAVKQPGRAMLAPELEGDLARSLKTSVAANQPWRLIGNPMPIARTNVPDVVASGIIPDPSGDEGLTSAKVLGWKGLHNLPFYPDTWDGYNWAREKLYDLSRAAGAADLIFLTGDSHSFWANQLADGAGRAAGIELGTAGISSPGDFVESGFDRATASALDRALEQHNPEVVWTDNLHQGYVRLNLTHEHARASFIVVDTVLSPQYRTEILNRFELVRRGGAVRLEPDNLV